MKNVKVAFKNWLGSWTCRLTFHTYANNGRLCLRLQDWETGEPIAAATINLPDVKLEGREIAIKDYSENQGMVEALISAGVIARPHAEVQIGGGLFARIAMLADDIIETECEWTGEAYPHHVFGKEPRQTILCSHCELRDYLEVNSQI